MPKLIKSPTYSFEQDTIVIHGQITIGSSGAVTSVQGGGLAGAVKESTAGQYTIALANKYNRLLNVDVNVIAAAKTSVAMAQVLETPANLQTDFKADGKVTIQCLDFAGAEVNPPSGAVLSVTIKVRRSSRGPYDSALS